MESNRETDRKRATALRKAGFTVVVMPRALEPVAPPITPLLVGSFAAELGDYLSAEPETPVKTLAEVVAANRTDPTQRAPFGQTHLIESLARPMTPAKAARTAKTHQARARARINKALRKGRVDILVTGEQAYAAAGYPAITVPGGYDKERGPTGPVFIGRYLSEPRLITAAYTYEQATHARKPPVLTAR
jgi:amidase